MHCAVNGAGLFERPWQGVKEQLEVEHIAAAGVEDVDAADVLPPLSAMDKVWLTRYHVSPPHLGRAKSASSNNELFIIFAVLELVEDRILRLAQVALKFGDGSCCCYLFTAFLKDHTLTTGKVNWQGCHAGVSVVDVETKDPPGGFTCRYLRWKQKKRMVC